MTKKSKNALSSLRTIDDVRRQQALLRQSLGVQEQQLHIDVNNIKAAWNVVGVINHRLRNATEGIRPALGYLGLGLSVAQLFLRCKKK